MLLGWCGGGTDETVGDLRVLGALAAVKCPLLFFLLPILLAVVGVALVVGVTTILKTAAVAEDEEIFGGECTPPPPPEHVTIDANANADETVAVADDAGRGAQRHVQTWRDDARSAPLSTPKSDGGTGRRRRWWRQPVLLLLVVVVEWRCMNRLEKISELVRERRENKRDACVCKNIYNGKMKRGAKNGNKLTEARFFLFYFFLFFCFAE